MSINSFRIKKSFGEKEVIRDFTFEVPAGRITALIGPNGSGKTTWIRIALGLLSADDGTVRYDSDPLSRVREHIAAVFDDPPIVKYLNGYDNLDVLSGGCAQNEQRKEILDALDLNDALLRQKGKAYSFGQRHKLAVAAALLRDPKYFFLDEPAVGLDLESWDRVSRIIRKQADRGCAVLITGHNYDLIEELADHAVLIRESVIYFAGEIRSLLEPGGSLKELYRQTFVDKADEQID